MYCTVKRFGFCGSESVLYCVGADSDSVLYCKKGADFESVMYCKGADSIYA